VAALQSCKLEKSFWKHANLIGVARGESLHNTSQHSPQISDKKLNASSTQDGRLAESNLSDSSCWTWNAAVQHTKSIWQSTWHCRVLILSEASGVVFSPRAHFPRGDRNGKSTSIELKKHAASWSDWSCSRKSLPKISQHNPRIFVY